MFISQHGAHTNEMKKLHNFICTKSRPRIFWKPKVMTLSTEGILKESKKTVDSKCCLPSVACQALVMVTLCAIC